MKLPPETYVEPITPQGERLYQPYQCGISLFPEGARIPEAIQAALSSDSYSGSSFDPLHVITVGYDFGQVTDTIAATLNHYRHSGASITSISPSSEALEIANSDSMYRTDSPSWRHRRQLANAGFEVKKGKEITLGSAALRDSNYVRFIEADISTALPKDIAQANLVTCTDTLHFVEPDSVANFVGNLAELVVPGGILNLSSHDRLLDKHFGGSKEQSWLRSITNDLVSHMGFTAIYRDYQDRPLMFAKS